VNKKTFDSVQADTTVGRHLRRELAHPVEGRNEAENVGRESSVGLDRLDACLTEGQTDIFNDRGMGSGAKRIPQRILGKKFESGTGNIQAG
jgi:hypothetical protein